MPAAAPAPAPAPAAPAAAAALLASPRGLSLPPFTRSVLALCAAIPAGRVATYGALARALGAPRAARAVGAALRANPFAPAVPCHRVVAADLSQGGFEGVARGGAAGARKRARLAAEGVAFDAAGRLARGAAALWSPDGEGARARAAAAAPAAKRRRAAAA